MELDFELDADASFVLPDADDDEELLVNLSLSDLPEDAVLKSAASNERLAVDSVVSPMEVAVQVAVKASTEVTVKPVAAVIDEDGCMPRPSWGKGQEKVKDFTFDWTEWDLTVEFSDKSSCAAVEALLIERARMASIRASAPLPAPVLIAIEKKTTKAVTVATAAPVQPVTKARAVAITTNSIKSKTTTAATTTKVKVTTANRQSLAPTNIRAEAPRSKVNPNDRQSLASVKPRAPVAPVATVAPVTQAPKAKVTTTNRQSLAPQPRATVASAALVIEPPKAKVSVNNRVSLAPTKPRGRAPLEPTVAPAQPQAPQVAAPKAKVTSTNRASLGPTKPKARAPLRATVAPAQPKAQTNVVIEPTKAKVSMKNRVSLAPGKRVDRVLPPGTVWF